MSLDIKTSLSTQGYAIYKCKFTENELDEINDSLKVKFTEDEVIEAVRAVKNEDWFIMFIVIKVE